MSENKRLRDPREAAGFLSEIVRQGRLILRLLGDRRVPIWPKLIVPASIAYLLSPIDFLSDPILGLGQLDDIAVLLIGLKLFVELCPRAIVEEHLNDLSSVVSGSYRVVEDEAAQEGVSQDEMIEAPEEPARPRLAEGDAEDEAAGSL